METNHTETDPMAQKGADDEDDIALQPKSKCSICSGDLMLSNDGKTLTCGKCGLEITAHVAGEKNKSAESEHEEHPWLSHEQAERVQADHDKEKSCPFCKSEEIRPVNAEGIGREKSFQCMKCTQRYS